jgi:DNA mismatch repair protein MutS2
MSGDSFHSDTRLDAFTHAGEILEFPSVLDLIASKCVNEGAGELIRGLRPSTDRAWIEERLGEIAEVREYHAVVGRLPVARTDCRVCVEGAVRRHEPIAPADLLAIASVERSGIDFQRSLEEEARYPVLRGIVYRLRPHREIIEAVGKAIDRNASIKDTASPALQSIRREITRARDELRRFAEAQAKSYGSADYATYTGSRHVLLVPRDKCRKKEGLVHAASHSGGSLYFEPFSLVEKNNALETLVHDEQVEEGRILGELARLVASKADELLENIRVWELLDSLDAKARFASELRCENPELSSDRSIRLAEARHPLLELSLRSEPGGRSIVPLSLSLPPEKRVLVVTGPNAGGKTVTIKTLGLAVLMFQAGLPVPCAEGTALPLFEAVQADIGDEQSIATSLSTFTSHLRHLDGMCRTSDASTLCLVDEIGDGTDPDEGSALAIATLERLRSRGATVVATTHYGKVKAYALRTDGVENASMAFDDENDRPLYRLLQGTAGRSRGIETARRMGFDSAVVKQAESLLGEEPYRLEIVLSQLEATQLSLEREREALRAQSDALNRLIAKYSEKEDSLSRFKQANEERIRRDIDELLVEARREIEALVRKIRETKAEKSAVSEAHHRVQEMIEKVREKARPRRARRISVADVVSLSPTGRPSGPVISIEGDAVIVELNGKRLSVKKWNLFEATDRTAQETGAEGEGGAPYHLSVEPLSSTAVDVRGQSREDALDALDRFLDRAVLGGVQEVLVIHGVGEGILLRAIREHLRSDSRVAASRQGMPGEGGMGVTVVSLR